MKFVENCGCNSNSGSGLITSWYDLQNTPPKNPFDLLANAYLDGADGVFAYSTTFVNPPGGTWVDSPMFFSAEAKCAALESDNQLMVANAAQWNFRHQTVNNAATLAPPMRKQIYLRGGTQWQMDINIDLGTSTSNLQLSFLDNAGTRGDYAGTIPVITFPGSYSGAVVLSVTLKTPGKVSMGLRMIETSSSDWSMFEMDWVIVP